MNRWNGSRLVNKKLWIFGLKIKHQEFPRSQNALITIKVGTPSPYLEILHVSSCHQETECVFFSSKEILKTSPFLTDGPCPAGQFDNIGTLQCEDCGHGFYQLKADKCYCYSCPDECGPGLLTFKCSIDFFLDLIKWIDSGTFCTPFYNVVIIVNTWRDPVRKKTKHKSRYFLFSIQTNVLQAAGVTQMPAAHTMVEHTDVPATVDTQGMDLDA